MSVRIRSWGLKDLCFTPNIPHFEEANIDAILQELFPCAIITPLDCFWEGSKILGPEFSVAVPYLRNYNFQWTHINPLKIIEVIDNITAGQADQAIRYTNLAFLEIMQRAGITTAYQEKPCLNTSDPLCPSTAPNRRKGYNFDIGSELTGGCYGFATKFMHWPEDLIVGSAQKNKSGQILKAKALQSLVQLMRDQDMYEYWKDDYKVHNIEWSVEKAKQVLEAWQRKFTEVRYDCSSKKFHY